jgi:hypothetical protein
MTLFASIDPVALQVEPDGEAEVVLRVRTEGTIVDAFRIDIVGPMARWARAEPSVIKLNPRQGREGEARIVFRPPKAPTPRAGTYDFGVHVRSEADPQISRVPQGRITVAPFIDLSTRIVPHTSSGSRGGSHTLTITNAGNATAEAAIGATNENDLLHFDVFPDRLELPADDPPRPYVVPLRARPKHTFFTGPPKQIPFTVKIDAKIIGSDKVIASPALPASLEQRPILPGWLRPAVSLAMAGVLAVVFLPRILEALGIIAYDFGRQHHRDRINRTIRHHRAVAVAPAADDPAADDPAANDPVAVAVDARHDNHVRCSSGQRARDLAHPSEWG